jgi:RNA polymerase sigma factor (sigma-70 family)
MRVQAKIQLKNYEMCEARKKIGLTQADLVMLTGIPIERMRHIENMQCKPTEDEVVDICDTLRVEASVLFPNGYGNIVRALTGIRRTQVAEYTEPLLDIENKILLSDITTTVSNALSAITPRERKIIEMRYGIGEYVGRTHTLEEIGDVLGIQRERVRQIEMKALCRLEHTDIIKDYRK